MNIKATELLFSYGTLQDAELQQILFGAQCRMRKAALPGWTLHVGPEGWLFIKPDPAGTVSGSLLELDAEALRAADLWEETPTLYQREKVNVRLDDGSGLEAWAYTRRAAAGVPHPGGALSLFEREETLAAVRRSILT
ncbi:gamma-glutamylcyclotransferase family protein [Candidatus Electronema sp. TJ]|uniref:gamma-glutamylcyclotransferase family protein n=1 Tax=Candidatus Electronema sp. TJ TaxID=3401573 RepID=UPI003AA8EE58